MLSKKTCIFLVLLSFVSASQGQTAAEVRTKGKKIAGSFVSITADGQTSDVVVTAISDGEVTEVREQIQGNTPTRLIIETPGNTDTVKQSMGEKAPTKDSGKGTKPAKGAKEGAKEPNKGRKMVKEPKKETKPPAEPKKKPATPTEPKKETMAPSEPKKEPAMPSEPKKETAMTTKPAKETMVPSEPKKESKMPEQTKKGKKRGKGTKKGGMVKKDTHMAPAEDTNPPKGVVAKVEEEADRVCLVTDFSRFDELLEQGKTVVAVRRFNKDLVEVTQAFKTDKASSSATVRSTELPKDVKALCKITEKDLKVVEGANVETIDTKVWRFTFKSDKKVPKNKAKFRKICNRLFANSISGIKESCLKAIDSNL